MDIRVKYYFILILLISTVSNANITLKNDCINIVEEYNANLIMKDGNYLYDLAVDYYDKNNILSFCLSSLAISKNNIDSKVLLSIFYEKGVIVEKDYHTAFSLSQEAAEQGSVLALNNLGDYYQYGIGVPIDINKSIYYYQEAIEKGNLDIAKINLAMLFFEKINNKKSSNKTIELLLDATNSDKLEMKIVAMTNLGGVYKHLGYNAEAFVWTKKAAELDSEVAETNLGFLFSEGIGTKPNGEKALYWLNKAMDKKYPESFFILATIYKNGSKSIEKNYSKALELYSIASDLDHGMAKNNLANMLFNGQGVVPDRLRALKLYLDAANNHNIAFSMYALYQIYSRGYEDIPKDPEKAKYWLEKAKENGLNL